VTAPEPEASPALRSLRAQIDALDHELLGVLGRRMRLVAELARTKRQDGRKIRDRAREAELLVDRTRVGRDEGLRSDFVESLFRLVVRESRDLQAALGVEAPVEVAPKTVAVIGGLGGMGRRLAELFEGLGHRVLIADVGTELGAAQAAAQADVTIISVPIAVTAQVIAEVGPHVPAHGLLMDVTSVKREPVAAMLAATSASVLGAHPMFGPGTSSFQGQRVVLCPGRGETWARWVEACLTARGLVITHAGAEEHDRAMALVQVLTHYQTQVLGVALARMGMPLETGLKFTSPAYLMELYVAARHFGQDPALYGPIEMSNPLTELVTRTFGEAASYVRDVLLRRDQRAFSAMFDEVRGFFGRFSEEATEQSKLIIDRLAERG
jgi:chorismate mutase / prephenate dehydrogenase